MRFKTVRRNEKSSVYAYLDAVLTYYKEAVDAHLSEWPEESIEWNSFSKTASFYEFVREWFAERNITIITYNNTNRYLSTFILAAEFPPTLGYAPLVTEIVRKQGWLSLYLYPEANLSAFVESVNLEDYTVVQRQSLNPQSDGYAAFLRLLQILSAIRYHLDSIENLESICIDLSIKKDWDIDLVLRIAHAYQDLIIPPQRAHDPKPTPRFTYQLTNKSKGMEQMLVIKHNLQKATTISMPSSIKLSRFTSGTLSFLADSQVVTIPEAYQVVKLECLDGMITVETSLTSEVLEVERCNNALKQVQCIITVKDQGAIPRQILLGQIRRQENFLVFDQSGNEIVSNTRLYKKGQVLRLVPLNKTVGIALKESTAFEQEDYTGMLPVFKAIDTSESSIVFGDITLDLCSVPFSFKLREQTPWEAAFNKKGKRYLYFYSPMMQIQLQGDFSGQQSPSIELNRLNYITENGIRTLVRTEVPANHHDGTITPKRPLAAPGVYELTVKFGEDKPSVARLNFLPIRNITLVEEKHFRLQLYAPAKKFELSGSDNCTCSWRKNIADIVCDAYGQYEFKASYCYTDANHLDTCYPLEFKFEAIQEVVGHFAKIVPPGCKEELSLETDLIANSYLEFKPNSFRTSSEPYRISTYLEYGGNHQRLFPEQQIMYTDGLRPFPLVPLVTYIKAHSFSRFLLLVTHGETEMYRVEFYDTRIPILNLEKEWNEGRYSNLTALPLRDLTKVEVLHCNQIPENSLVYGMVDNAFGKSEFKTYATYVEKTVLKTDDLVSHFLSLCNQTMCPNEKKQRILMDILSSPSDAFKLMKWLSLAHDWRYPYDIKIYAKILETYPILVAWAELARNPANREQVFALIEPIELEARMLQQSRKYFYPQLLRIADHPRFSPELITMHDIETLYALKLLPTDNGLNMRLCLFCTVPFISGSKPVLSWITLFWLRAYSVSLGKIDEFRTLLQQLEQLGQPLAPLVAREFTTAIPQYKSDTENQQNFRRLLSSEHCHYESPPLTTIKGLQNFLGQLEDNSFGKDLARLVSVDPLRYAEPYLREFIGSTKWRAIIFLSLTAVCTQLERKPFLTQLHSLWRFDHKTYVYLLKWMNNNQETAQIYNAYYEYWMTCFWRADHV